MRGKCKSHNMSRLNEFTKVIHNIFLINFHISITPPSPIQNPALERYREDWYVILIIQVEIQSFQRRIINRHYREALQILNSDRSSITSTQVPFEIQSLTYRSTEVIQRGHKFSPCHRHHAPLAYRRVHSFAAGFNENKHPWKMI